MESSRKILKKISNYAIVGGLGSVLLMNMTGCEDKSNNQYGQNNAMSNASQKQGAFVVVEKTSQGGYQIVDEFPSSKTTILLREGNKERILSKEEIDSLVLEESKRIDNGTSNLTNGSQIHSGGMSLGETLLASAAGAMIGSYIGNKLFNNNNFNSKRRTSYKSPQAYSKSVNSFNKAKTSSSRKTTSSKKGGFFGGGKSSSRRSFFGG